MTQQELSDYLAFRSKEVTAQLRGKTIASLELTNTREGYMGGGGPAGGRQGIVITFECGHKVVLSADRRGTSQGHIYAIDMDIREPDEKPAN